MSLLSNRRSSSIATNLFETSPPLTLEERSNITGNETTSVLLLSRVDRILWQVVPPVLLVCGTFGNVMTIVVMRGMTRAGQSFSCMSLYFTVLAVSDLLVLFTDLVPDCLKSAFDIDIEPLHAATCKVLRFASHTCAMTSGWFLIAMTYQRVTSVVLPHRVSVLCTAKRGKLVIAGIVIICALVNAQFLYTFTRVPSSTGGGKADYQCDVIRNKQARYYINHVHSWIDLFLKSVLPFLFLMTGNSLLVNGLIRSVRQTRKMVCTASASGQTRSRESKVSSLTITLVLTSLAFLLLTSPTSVMDLYVESIEDLGQPGNETLDPGFRAGVRLAESVCHLLWFANSAVNFFLYCVSGNRFRAELKRCFSKDK